MSSPKLSKKQAIAKLWRMGNLEWKLKGIQKEMRDAIYNSKGKKTVFLVSRRSGKCLEEGTKVITTKGMKNIEEVQPGDYVYGYNYDGSVTPTRVKALVYQGEKEVVELTNGGKVMATCTLDHPWMTYNTCTKQLKELKTSEFVDKSHIKIKREFVKSPCGPVNEPHAYSLAALLGDGCSREKGFSIVISSENDIIPKKIAKDIGCLFYKTHKNNYSWKLSLNPRLEYRGQKKPNHINRPPEIHYYDDWCRGKYAHEKIADLDVIKTWDRESCLNFIAGLIDTDGCIQFHKNRLFIQFASQSKSLVNAFKFLFNQLFQYDPNINIDKRSKYVNGPCYSISISNNLFSKIALKELSPYLQLPRKKWKEEYESALENNSNREFVGVKRGKTKKVTTWDLSIENESELYLLANGLVTHNTFTMMVVGVETCLKKPNSIVKVLFPKKKDAQDVARFQMKSILDDCPPELMPIWNEQKRIYTFANGSEMQMAGTDGGSAESVRGSACDLAILDEAGFHDYNDFTYIVNSIIMPTLLTTKGKMILASTPSKEPDHPFMTNYVIPFRMSGDIIEYDVYHNPMISQEDIKEIADEYPGGIEDPDFQREFLLKSDIMTDDFVVPEFTKDVQKDLVVRTDQLPPFYDYYVSGDPAGRDLTVILFGYYDFMNQRLVICDELVRGGGGDIVTTMDIADGIKRKESLLFSNPLTGETKEPYLRIMDNNNKILINDLQSEHGLNFIATDKDNKIAQVNKLRMMVRQGQIFIDPKCKNLIYHLQTARWKKNSRGEKQTQFLRAKGDKSKDLKEHHADAVDALIYMIRNVNFTKDPYPNDYFDLKGNNIFNSNQSKYVKNQGLQGLVKSIMNINKDK